MRTPAALLLVALIAGCGTESGESGAVPGTTSAVDDSIAPTSPVETSTRPTAATPSTGDSSDDGSIGDGEDPERFCEITDELEGVGDFFSLPPDRAQPLAERFLELIVEAYDVAPQEIRSQVGAIAQGFVDLYPAYEAFGFDATKLDDDVIASLFRDERDVREAVEAGEIPIEEWVESNCLARS